MLNCPHCKKPLKEIHVYYEASCAVDLNGEVLYERTDFNSDWGTFPIIDAECRECGRSIKNFLKKKAPNFPYTFK